MGVAVPCAPGVQHVCLGVVARLFPWQPLGSGDLNGCACACVLHRPARNADFGSCAACSRSTTSGACT